MTRSSSSADGSSEQPASPGKRRSLVEITSTPLRVALAYAFAGVVWIVTTDRIVQWFFGSGSHLLHAQTIKGIAYVVTTTALVYWLTRQAVREAQSTRLTGERLLLTQALLENVLASLGDAVLVVDPDTRSIVQCNPATELVFGYEAEELIGQNAAMLYMSPEAYQTLSALSETVLESHGVFHTECRMRRKDGTVIETEHTITPIHEGLGWKAGMVSIVREISERKQAEALMTTRLKIQEIAATLPLSGLLRKTLDEVERLTGSEVGFYHFVEPDQRTLSLQAWSTRTTEEFCTAQGGGLHYNIDDAGVWVDCVHERRPVIHNDYATLPHKKGLPEGHSPVIRELVVPVIRKEKMVAILGIGNKPTDYTREDVEQVSSLADISWEIIERKRAEEQAMARARQQAVIAELGERALRGEQRSNLMDLAVSRIGEVLDVDLCGVFELLPDQSKALLKAGVGWENGSVGFATIPLDLSSHAGFTLERGGSVVVEDLRADDRFQDSRLLLRHGVVSGLSTPIGDPERPYGILSAHDTVRRVFSVQDIHFLQGVANLLASAVYRETQEAEIKRKNRLYATLSQVNQAIVRCQSKEDLFGRLCRVAVEQGGFNSAWISVRDPDKGRMTNLTQYPPIESWTLSAFGPSHDCTIVEEAMRSGRPCVNNDTQGGERAKDCFIASSRSDIRSCAAFPIPVQEGLSTALGLCSSEPGFFNADELELLKAVSQDIAHAIENLEQEARRREAERGLTESEARLKLALTAAKQGIFDLNVQTGDTIVTPEYATMMGYDPSGFHETNAAWIERLHPEDRDVVVRAFRDYVEGRLPEYRVEFRQKTSSGDWKWILSLGSVIEWDADGRPLRMLGTHTDIDERKRAEAERERLMAAIEQAGETVLITDPRGTIQYVNPAFEAVTGYAPQEAIGKTPRLLRSGRQSPRFYEELWSTIASGRIWKGRMVNQRKDGTLFAEEATISPVRDASGQIVNYVAVKRDLTDELQLEAQLAQAQKMESVGRLAGGVAHDFNNMLGVILGNTEMALLQASPDTPLHDSLTEVRKAAHRSADLTRQLLAFARKQTIDPRPLNLNTTVEGMLKMLRRLIGEQIQLAWHPGEALWLVNMDPAQIDQILANLCVNARDAIAENGSVAIEVRNVTLDETHCTSQYGGIPGDYVMLTVSDDGCGMDEETREHIFEPFFTTKEIGKGTGLGLSTVYGIVKQNNGFISVASELGRGSAFKIHLPRLKRDDVQTAQTEPETLPRGHGETVLLVEDEVAILNMTKRALERLGYNVLASASPGEAIRLAQDHAGRLDLLMSDVVMPEMNGKELSERLSERQPELKRLYMSGYTSDVIGQHGVLDPGIHFIQKPFSMQDLAVKLREVLDAG